MKCAQRICHRHSLCSPMCYELLTEYTLRVSYHPLFAEFVLRTFPHSTCYLTKKKKKKDCHVTFFLVYFVSGTNFYGGMLHIAACRGVRICGQTLLTWNFALNKHGCLDYFLPVNVKLCLCEKHFNCPKHFCVIEVWLYMSCCVLFCLIVAIFLHFYLFA